MSLFVASLTSYWLMSRIHSAHGQGKSVNHSVAYWTFIMPLMIGVHIELNEVDYGSDGIVNITDIGEGDSGSLLCVTNNTNCCKTPAMGEWYFPNNMSAVRIKGKGDSFYRDRGPSVVRLHRKHNATMPTGSFCCEAPDANEVIQRVCITIEATVPFEGL